MELMIGITQAQTCAFGVSVCCRFHFKGRLVWTWLTSLAWTGLPHFWCPTVTVGFLFSTILRMPFCWSPSCLDTRPSWFFTWRTSSNSFLPKMLHQGIRLYFPQRWVSSYIALLKVNRCELLLRFEIFQGFWYIITGLYSPKKDKLWKLYPNLESLSKLSITIKNSNWITLQVSTHIQSYVCAYVFVSYIHM